MNEDLRKQLDTLQTKRSYLEKELDALNVEIFEIENLLQPENHSREENWNAEHEGTVKHDEPEPKLYEREKIYD
jgi:hypothetical protein